MDDKKLHRCFTFSEEQLKHLRSKKYKIDRMECFMSLVDLAEPVPKLVQISKTKQVEILAGQVMVDNTKSGKTTRTLLQKPSVSKSTKTKRT